MVHGQPTDTDRQELLAHGTVTGAAGGVLLRPFARLISKAGDSVTTYGDAWNMN